MRLRPTFAAHLLRNRDGAMIIETAIVAPVLVLMALGAFQVSAIVARQAELQEAAAEATAIALAAPPDSAEKRTTLEQVIEASTGLAANQVAVSLAFRCDDQDVYVTDPLACSTAKVASSFVKIELSDTYVPAWLRFGIGAPVNYSVTRYVQYQQEQV